MRRPSLQVESSTEPTVIGSLRLQHAVRTGVEKRGDDEKMMDQLVARMDE